MVKTKTSRPLNRAAWLSVCLALTACASGDMTADSEDGQGNSCVRGRSDNRLDCVTPLDDVIFAQAKGDFAFTVTEKFTNRKDHEITWAALNGPFYFRFFQSTDAACNTPSIGTNSLNGTTELKTNAVMNEDGAYFFCAFADSDKYPTIAARNNGMRLTLDTIAPLAPVMTAVQITTNPQPRWNWRSDDPTSSKIYRAALGSDNFGENSPETTGTFYQPASPLEDGSYTLFVQVRDEAGNWSPAVHRTTIIDTTPPTPELSQFIDPDEPTLLQVVITFTEPVNGLAPEDIQLTNAVLESLSASDDMKSYLAILTATGSQPVATVVAGCCTDAAGNLSLAGSSLPLTVTP